MAAVSVYSVEGFAGLGGRMLMGVLADRLGAKPVLIGGLMLQALAIGAYLPVNGLGEFYVARDDFGARLRRRDAALCRDGARIFRPQIMGTVFGAATMVSCLGMAAGPGRRRLDVRPFRNYARDVPQFPRRSGLVP